MRNTTIFIILLSSLAISGFILAIQSGSNESTENTFRTDTRPKGLKITEVEKIALGKAIFFDTTLSDPAGQSCATCHDPAAGFANPIRSNPTSEGAVQGLFGNRNAPTIAYSQYSPEFYFDGIDYIGGHFLDGRASTLEIQSSGPPMNPVEMHNRDLKSYAAKISSAEYAHQIGRIYGKTVFDDPKQMVFAVADALATYERSSEVSRFTSKFDAYLRGKVQLSPKEMKGLKLFNTKANCHLCHPSSNEDLTTVHGLFSEYDYHNLGVPKNANNKFYTLPPQYNPQGKQYIDIGLAANPTVITEGRAEQSRGKFKTPTLRNIELTGPYMHNGVFTSLKQVVSFYNTRDSDPGHWGKPEVAENIEKDFVGNLHLTPDEEDAIVAFLMTLTDGYEIPENH